MPLKPVGICFHEVAAARIKRGRPEYLLNALRYSFTSLKSWQCCGNHGGFALQGGSKAAGSCLNDRKMRFDKSGNG